MEQDIQPVQDHSEYENSDDENPEEEVHEINFYDIWHQNFVQSLTANTFPHIPKTLCAKALYHHDQLTEEDKQVLRGRGDMAGRVLADPDSPTDEEVHDFLLWPPPDEVRAKILRVTRGAISTPQELFAKAQGAIDRNEFQATMSSAEITLIVGGFYLEEDQLDREATSRRFYRSGQSMSVTGNGEASSLLMRRRFGLTSRVLKMASVLMARAFEEATFEQILSQYADAQLVVVPGSGADPRTILAAIEDLYRQIGFGLVAPEEAATQTISLTNALAAAIPRRRVVFPPPPTHPTPPSMEDQFGMAPWPPVGAPYPPYTLFMNDHPQMSGYEASPAWFYLTDIQKNVYRAKSERLRREAWDRHNNPPASPATVASSTSPTPPAPPAPPPWPPYEDSVGVDSWPPLVEMMSPIALFKRDKKGRPREESSLEAWRQVTDEERLEYRSRSEELRLKAWADHERFKAAGHDDVGYPYTGKLFEKHVQVEGVDEYYGRPQVRGHLPEKPDVVGGLSLFSEEVGPSIGVGVRTGIDTGTGMGPRRNKEHSRMVCERFEELSEQERQEYAARARTINQQNQAEFRQIMQGIPPEKDPHGTARRHARPWVPRSIRRT